MQAFIVIQDKEIDRYKLRDYFGSSFLTYAYKIFDYNRDHPRNFTNKQLVYITEPYSLYDRKIFPTKETITPRKNSAKLLKIHEKNNLERIFLFYINEVYEAKIIDMTLYENKKVDEVYSNNLMPIFIKFLSNIKCEKESKHWSENKSNLLIILNKLQFYLKVMNY